MKTESTDVITHVCWDMDPKTKARCRRDPHHQGDHYPPPAHRGTTPVPRGAADLPPVPEAGGGRGAGGFVDHGFGHACGVQPFRVD